MSIGRRDRNFVAVRDHARWVEDHPVDAGFVHLGDQIFRVEVRNLTVDRTHRGVDPDMNL